MAPGTCIRISQRFRRAPEAQADAFSGRLLPATLESIRNYAPLILRLLFALTLGASAIGPFLDGERNAALSRRRCGK